MIEAIIDTETIVTVGGKPINDFIQMVANAAHSALVEQSIIRQRYNLPEDSFEDSELYFHEILNLLKE